jgi:starch synthase
VGFSFKTYSEAALKRKLQQALNVYKKSPAKWRALQKAGMNRDFSWDRSADKYIELYRRIS